VIDDGPGLPAGFAPGRQGLGTQIVQALVAGELSGSIDWTSNPGGGTRVVLRARLKEGGGSA
jgi:two-component sensor histidine kinase